MYIKEDIIENMGTSATEIIDWMNIQPGENFVKGPTKKWNASQHLDHLYQVVVLVNKALRLPKFILRWRFGKPNRKGRDYDTIVAKYQNKLKTLSSTIKPPGGKKHLVADKPDLLNQFELQIQRLQKGLDKWTEEDLDKYLFPHPLLGKVTVRELMLWMIYHHYHHLNNLKSNY